MIKTFETFSENKQYLYDLMIFLEKFMKENTNCDFFVKSDGFATTFYYKFVSNNMVSGIKLFTILKHYGTTHFEFSLSVLNENLPQDVVNVINYIYNVITHFDLGSTQRTTNIPQIINNITSEGYQVYLSQKNYNI